MNTDKKVGMREGMEADLAWLACAIDGEGSLCVHPQFQRGYASYRFSITIINTNREFVMKSIEVFRAIDTSPMRLYEHSYDDPKYKTTYRSNVYGKRQVLKVLRAVMPWLIIKRKFAFDMLSYLERTRERSETRRPMEPWEYTELERIRAKHMPRSKPFAVFEAHANGGTPAPYEEDEAIPCQAEGSDEVGTSEGVETRSVSNASNNQIHERPASPSFPPKRKEKTRMTMI